MRASETVAWNVRALRTAKGLSQEALADGSGIDRSFVSQIERAKVSVTVAMLEKLAATLGVDIATLVTEPPADAPEPPPMRSGRKSRA